MVSMYQHQSFPVPFSPGNKVSFAIFFPVGESVNREQSNVRGYHHRAHLLQYFIKGIVKPSSLSLSS